MGGGKRISRVKDSAHQSNWKKRVCYSRCATRTRVYSYHLYFFTSDPSKRMNIEHPFHHEMLSCCNFFILMSLSCFWAAGLDAWAWQKNPVFRKYPFLSSWGVLLTFYLFPNTYCTTPHHHLQPVIKRWHTEKRKEFFTLCSSKSGGCRPPLPLNYVWHLSRGLWYGPNPT